MKRLWIEQASDIAKEYYLSLTFDRGAKKPLFMFTTQGGVEIEQVAEENPDALVRLHVDPLEGFKPWQARRLVYGAGVTDPSRAEADREDHRPALRRVRPVRRDALRDQPADRHARTASSRRSTRSSRSTTTRSTGIPTIAEMRDEDAADPLEALARAKHVTYVKLDGEVGVLRQRRRADDVDRRRGHVRRRPARELLRPRRRRRRAGRRRRALGDHARPAGEGDLLQHLRRHHALRRGRARDPAGARRDGARAADRRPPRRHERRGGPAASSPRRRPPNLHVAPTMLEAAALAVELAA